jgi:hypothetical protein
MEISASTCKGGKLKKTERCAGKNQMVANERDCLGVILENRG